MKPIHNLTGLQNLLELIKVDNPAAGITESNVSLSAPTYDDQTGRTTVMVTATLDAGYSGSKSIDYLRHNLSSYISDNDFLIVDGTETEEELKAKISETFGVVNSDVNWVNAAVPGLVSNQAVIITLDVSEGYIYSGAESVDMIATTVDITTDARGNGADIRVTTTGEVRGVAAATVVSFEPAVGVYFGGYSQSDFNNTVYRTNDSGNVISYDNTVGFARSDHCGVQIDGKAFFHGGMDEDESGALNTLTIIDRNGVQVGSDITVGTERGDSSSLTFNTKGVFYGGFTTDYGSDLTATALVLDGTGTMIGNEITLSTERELGAGASLNTVGILYAGIDVNGDPINNVSVITSDVVQVGVDTFVGTARGSLGGAAANNKALFWGGVYTPGSAPERYMTILDATGTLVGTELVINGPKGFSGINMQSGINMPSGAQYLASDYTSSAIYRFDENGSQLSAENSLTVDLYYTAGAGLPMVGGTLPSTAGRGIHFGGGGFSGNYLTSVTVTNDDGAELANNSVVMTGRKSIAGASIANKAVFWGGMDDAGGTNLVNIIDNTGTQIGSEQAVGVVHSGSPGAIGFGTTGFYTEPDFDNDLSFTKFLDETGAQTGSESTIAIARSGPGAASMGTVGVFFGGLGSSSIVTSSTVVDNTGTVIASEPAVGTGRYVMGGAATNNNALFWAGYDDSTPFVNTMTILSATGTSVTSETTVGSAGVSSGCNMTNDAQFMAAGMDGIARTWRFDSTGSQIGTEVVMTVLRMLHGAVGLTVTAPGTVVTPTESAIYYGGYEGDYVNTVTVVDGAGNQVGSELSAGTGRNFFGGAQTGPYATFFGGDTAAGELDAIDRFDSTGNMVGTETVPTVPRRYTAGVSFGNWALFWGGELSSPENTGVVIDYNGNVIDSTKTAGVAQAAGAAAKVDGNAYYYGGMDQGGFVNRLTVISEDVILKATDSTLGTARVTLGGGSCGNNGIFFGGAFSGGATTNLVTLIAPGGTLVATESTISVTRTATGASMIDHAQFYGKAGDNINYLSRVNDNGLLVSADTTPGSTRDAMAGCGIVKDKIPATIEMLPEIGIHYGGSNPFLSTTYDLVTRLSVDGALIGSESNVGSAVWLLGGGSIGDTALFYGGQDSAGATIVPVKVTRIDANGAILGSEVTPGGAGRETAAGASLTTGVMFYGGAAGIKLTNAVSKFDANGALLTITSSAIGTARSVPAGAAIGDMAIYHGGLATVNGAPNNLTTLIDGNGVQHNIENVVGTMTGAGAGVNAGSVTLFYAGGLASGDTNVVTRIDDNGQIVGAESNVGSARRALSSAGLGAVGQFYGGADFSVPAVLNTLTSINNDGSQYGSESSVGTGRFGVAGASLRYRGTVPQPTVPSTDPFPEANIGLFFGGVNGSATNLTTRIDDTGNQIGTEFSAEASARQVTGASTNNVGVFWGGFASDKVDYLTRLNSNGIVIDRDFTVGTATAFQSAARANNYVVFYGGQTAAASPTDQVVRFDYTGTMMGSEGALGTARSGAAGASIGDNAMFYGGYDGATQLDTVTIIDNDGLLVGTETSVTVSRANAAGAELVGNNQAMFYGGVNATDTVTRIDATGARVGSDTTLGISVIEAAGVPSGSNGMFYGGNDGASTVNSVKLIDANGAAVSTNTTAGAGAQNLGGAKMVASIWATPGTDISVAVFYAGWIEPSGGSCVTRTDFNGTPIEINTVISGGDDRGEAAGTNNLGIGLIYGGRLNSDNSYSNMMTLIDSTGASVSASTNVGTAVTMLGAGTALNTSVFYAGNTEVTMLVDTVMRFNAQGDQLGVALNAGTARMKLAGVTSGDYAMFYGGYEQAAGFSNRVTLLDTDGLLVGSEVAIGTARLDLIGASTSVATFVGGNTGGNSETMVNTVTRIDGTTGTPVITGNETSAGAIDALAVAYTVITRLASF